MLKQVQHDYIQWNVILNSFQDLSAEIDKKGSWWDAETSSAWLHTMDCHPELFSGSVRRERQEWLAVRCWNEFSMTAYNGLSSWTRFKICPRRKTRKAHGEMLKQVQHDCIQWNVILNSFQDLFAEKDKKGSLWDAETSSAWLHTMNCHPDQTLLAFSSRRHLSTIL